MDFDLDIDLEQLDIDLNLDLDIDFNDDEELVDFSEINCDIPISVDNKYFQIKEKNKYTMNNGLPILYNNNTTEYYYAIRKSKTDPLIEIEVEDSYAFKFVYEWDPYTGIRGKEDPYGALYFDPDTLTFPRS